MHFVQAKGILSPHNGMNIYRGCTHGCIYCDSRSDCYGMEHAFEDIEVKLNAPLDLHFPGLKQAYIKKYGYDYELPSDKGAQLMEYIRSACATRGVMHGQDEIFAYLSEFPEKRRQLSLFD